MTDELVRLLDHFHPSPSDNPYWTESSWFSWAIPEKGINGFVWIHFRPNMNCVCGGPAMWDASGMHVWQFPFFDWQAMRVPPAGKAGVDYDKFSFTTEWSMTHEVLEPLRAYRLGYDRAGFKLDLTFTSNIAPNLMAPHGELMRSAFQMHFEQPGRIAGFVELDGVRHAVDCFGIRDGGHGPRHIEAAKPGAYSWSTADDGTGWHMICPDASGGHLAPAIAGYLLRDGVIAPLAEGSRRVLERSGPRPIALEMRGRDTLGREFHALGKERAPAEFVLFGDRGQWWNQFAWDYDGFTGALGEDQEFYGIHEFRKWHRAGPEVWQTR